MKVLLSVLCATWTLSEAKQNLDSFPRDGTKGKADSEKNVKNNIKNLLYYYIIMVPIRTGDKTLYLHVHSESYNYTFHSLGTVYAIVILAYVLQSMMDKSMIIYLHVGSLIGIVVISHKYFTNFDKTVKIEKAIE